jgi:hypothetical protein
MDVRFRGQSGHGRAAIRCLLLMLWGGVHIRPHIQSGHWFVIAETCGVLRRYGGVVSASITYTGIW